MLGDLDKLVQNAIAEKTFPAVEVLVAKGRYSIAHGVWGNPANDGIPLKFNSIFDIASITKPVATATLLRHMIKIGALTLDDRFSRYFPEFIGDDKESITLGQLAFHTSGLPADMPLAKMTDDPVAARQLLMNVTPIQRPSTRTVYSCVGYIVLSYVMEHVLKMPLDRAFKQYVATPMNLTDTQFAPSKRGMDDAHFVPTTNQLSSAGVVHDSTARVLGGKVGNAGLFSTARDLHKFAVSLLDEQDPFSFKNGNAHPLGARTFGWELKTSKDDDCSCGPAFPVGSIGHTGFTGTSLWMDPKSKLIVIALSNRTFFSHRENIPKMKQFRSRLHDLVARHELCTLGTDSSEYNQPFLEQAKK